jgi:hypothetical protein
VAGSSTVHAVVAWRRISRSVLLLALAVACACAAAQADAGAALRARFEALRQQGTGALAGRPLYLQSSETAQLAQGDVHALVDHPFEALRDILLRADSWCGILILHLNVQYCRAGGSAVAPRLDIGMGRKVNQALDELFWMQLGWRVVAAGDARLVVVMQAAGGPFGTRDFRIEFEAVPFDATRTLVHLGYGYGYGTVARWAMQVYLATLGRDKTGFSVVGLDAAGRPMRVDGLRGLLERNTLRYELAIEAYLDAPGTAGAQSLSTRLQNWFDATERHASQLHEVERADYIATKLGQVQRAAASPPPAP